MLNGNWLSLTVKYVAILIVAVGGLWLFNEFLFTEEMMEETRQSTVQACTDKGALLEALFCPLPDEEVSPFAVWIRKGRLLVGWLIFGWAGYLIWRHWSHGPKDD